MIKKSLKYFILLCIVIFAASCTKENRWECIKRTGTTTIEKRKLNDFTLMDINGNFNIILIQDTINEASIETGKNLMPMIQTDVSNGRLTLRNDNRCNWTRSYADEIKIYLHIKDMYQIHVNSCCTISNTDTIKLNDFFIEVAQNSVSHINLTLDTKNFQFAQHSGSGTYIFKGITEYSYYYQKGAGQINATNFKATTTHVVNKSSGDVHVQVLWKLIIEYTGSGNVYYKGNPTEIYYAEAHNPGRLIKEE